MDENRKLKLERTNDLIIEGYTLPMIHEMLHNEFGSSLSDIDIKQCRLEVDRAPFDESQYKTLFHDAFTALLAIQHMIKDTACVTDADIYHIFMEYHVDLNRMKIADMVYTITQKVIQGAQANPDIFYDSPTLVHGMIDGLLDLESGWVYSKEDYLAMQTMKKDPTWQQLFEDPKSPS